VLHTETVPSQSFDRIASVWLCFAGRSVATGSRIEVLIRMERKMLLGLKRRAEHAQASPGSRRREGGRLIFCPEPRAGAPLDYHTADGLHEGLRTPPDPMDGPAGA
jgi:hypothetical protein